jgi:hypothetical protein
MPGVPSFVKTGSSAVEQLSGGKFVRLESGKAVEIIPLTGLEPPPGEDPNGSNCVISFQQYAIWMDDLPEGKKSPVFPAIGGKYDCGAILGLTPKFRALMLVTVNGEEDEKILPMGAQVFKELAQIEMATGQPLKGCVLRLVKTGVGMATRYKVVFTGRHVTVEGEPQTDLMDYVGPQTREEIVQMLEAVGKWPPPGGDPMVAEKPAKSGKKAPVVESFADVDD